LGALGVARLEVVRLVGNHALEPRGPASDKRNVQRCNSIRLRREQCPRIYLCWDSKTVRKHCSKYLTAVAKSVCCIRLYVTMVTLFVVSPRESFPLRATCARTILLKTRQEL
jgi:hypothetical protein